MEEKEIIEKPSARTQTEQDKTNHLVLGITMCVSATLTCLTTILAVGQTWCLVVLILPFAYIMFPEIQKRVNAMTESGYRAYKEMKRERKAELKAEKQQAKVEAKKQQEEQKEEEVA